MYEQPGEYSAKLIDLLDCWGIDLRGGAPAQVRVLRHAGDKGVPHRVYYLGDEEFEWYQSSQNRKIFGDAAILASFIGAERNEAIFVGLYRILGLTEGLIDPPFTGAVPKELISSCNCRFHYRLARMTEFDRFRERIRIAWDSQANRWAQQFPEANKKIVAFKTDAGDWLVPRDRESLLNMADIPTDNSPYTHGSGAYSEGARILRIHFEIERNAALVRDAKARFRKLHNGCLYCQACQLDFKRVYGEDCIECHHTIPVHKLPSNGSTDIDDLVLLCPNCHRMIHHRKEWLTLNQLRTILGRLNIE